MRVGQNLPSPRHAHTHLLRLEKSASEMPWRASRISAKGWKAPDLLLSVQDMLACAKPSHARMTLDFDSIVFYPKDVLTTMPVTTLRSPPSGNATPAFRMMLTIQKLLVVGSSAATSLYITDMVSPV